MCNVYLFLSFVWEWKRNKQKFKRNWLKNFLILPNSKKKIIYTTKTIDSVWEYVCLSVCLSVYMYVCMYGDAFVVHWGIELRYRAGMWVGNGAGRFVGIFSKWPHQRSKVIQRSYCFRNVLWTPNLVGSKVMQGSTGVNRGSNIDQECPMATKFGRKNPLLKCKALLGSKVIFVSTRITQGSNSSGMPYSHQIW